MGYLSCNAESAIATCDPHNWDLPKKALNKPNSKKTFKIREFSYSDLDSATGGFSPQSFLGKGSHGFVYKAILDGGRLVAAVKRTTVNCTNCTSNSVENEIEILSHVRSPRLVNLLGFGVDPKQRKLILVEFMPNGSLYDLLHTSPKPPSWARRVRFAVQIAKAVQLLHALNPPVIHRDIKSSNVLIDCDWSARLGDFGLALRGQVEDARVKCTPPAGTLGYLDPGYLVPGDLSAKSDVFSFGILLLEIISGRNAIDVDYSPSSVVDWAKPLIKGGYYAAICDPRIPLPEHPAVKAAIRQMAVVAARCVRSTAENRPAMTDVVKCLRTASKSVSLSLPIWHDLGQCMSKSTQPIKFEPLDDSTEIIRAPHSGSRRNRKVCSAPRTEVSGEDARSGRKERVARSRSVGSGGEMKWQPLDSRRTVGLAVKMPTVRLSKSRSMGMLPSNSRFVVQLVRNPSNGEMERSKLLINVEKEGPEVTNA
ncbi:Non-specific serine/threonine protein kinase [Bertholletia excelsa]